MPAVNPGLLWQTFRPALPARSTRPPWQTFRPLPPARSTRLLGKTFQPARLPSSTGPCFSRLFGPPACPQYRACFGQTFRPARLPAPGLQPSQPACMPTVPGGALATFRPAPPARIPGRLADLSARPPACPQYRACFGNLPALPPARSTRPLGRPFLPPASCPQYRACFDRPSGPPPPCPHTGPASADLPARPALARSTTAGLADLSARPSARSTGCLLRQYLPARPPAQQYQPALADLSAGLRFWPARLPETFRPARQCPQYQAGSWQNLSSLPDQTCPQYRACFGRPSGMPACPQFIRPAWQTFRPARLPAVPGRLRQTFGPPACPRTRPAWQTSPACPPVRACFGSLPARPPARSTRPLGRPFGPPAARSTGPASADLRPGPPPAIAGSTFRPARPVPGLLPARSTMAWLAYLSARPPARSNRPASAPPARPPPFSTGPALQTFRPPRLPAPACFGRPPPARLPAYQACLATFRPARLPAPGLLRQTFRPARLPVPGCRPPPRTPGLCRLHPYRARLGGSSGAVLANRNPVLVLQFGLNTTSPPSPSNRLATIFLPQKGMSARSSGLRSLIFTLESTLFLCHVFHFILQALEPHIDVFPAGFALFGCVVFFLDEPRHPRRF
ncbi:basic proline-rich protein-like [Macrobrachium nipponense]|uniref:basic proline-rich protein-like n=1 Tax=Macrobrachium nipponense TaxID=159736 RepID=UPI0030C7C0E6